MKPIIAYLIMLALQVVAGWELLRWVFKETCSGTTDEQGMFFGFLCLELIGFILFNVLLYQGGFYRLPWTW